MKEGSNLRSSVNSISKCNPSIAPITFGKKRPTFLNSEAILQIHMVLAIGSCGLNWQAGHP